MKKRNKERRRSGGRHCEWGGGGGGVGGGEEIGVKWEAGELIDVELDVKVWIWKEVEVKEDVECAGGRW